MKKVIVLVIIFFAGLYRTADSMTLEGLVKPAHEVDLALSLDGVIAKIFVKEGDIVKKGEGLLTLDDTVQKLEVKRRSEIYQDNAEFESSRDNLVILKSLLDSSQELFEKTASVSHDEIKNLQMQYHSLSGKVKALEAKKKQEFLDYKISTAVLERYALISPIDGIVTAIKPEEGEWAKTGEILITVVDKSVCTAEFNIDERYARSLKKGKAVTLKVQEGNIMSAKTGKITFVSPVADKASALVNVKVEFENKSGSVIPGVLAYINLE